MDQKTKLLETRAKLRKKPFDYHVTLPVNRVYELDFGGMGGNDGRRDYSELTNVVEGVDMDLLNLPFPEKLHFTAEEMEASDWIALRNTPWLNGRVTDAMVRPTRSNPCFIPCKIFVCLLLLTASGPIPLPTGLCNLAVVNQRHGRQQGAAR